MSKLALMYACGNCFNYVSKKTGRDELRSYAGIERTFYGGHQSKTRNDEEDDTSLRNMSVHGADHQHTDDHGETPYLEFK